MGKKDNPAQNVINQAQTAYNQNTPSPLEQQAGQMSNNFMNNYNEAAGQAKADYGNIMSGYSDFRNNLGGPSKFSYQNVSAPRPAELGESYGYLREAMPGYRDFANTGGYSAQDIQDLRARGMSPITSAYGNTMRELDRARALGGAGGSTNYIAALSRAQRDQPQQLSDAMQNVNAGLAESIRQGKEFGLSGITGTGATMGGLSSQEAGRQLQASLANQAADLQTQQMGEQSLQNLRQMQLASLGGQSSLYGTTPGMASMFGNQALNSFNTAAQMQANRQNYGLGLLDTQLRGYGANEGQQGTPWWQTALGIAGTVAPFFSDENMKYDVKPLRGSVNQRLKKLPINKWKYKGETTTHLGPMAQAFKKAFGVGDGRTLHPADIMGVVLASQKEAVAHA